MYENRNSLKGKVRLELGIKNDIRESPEKTQS